MNKKTISVHQFFKILSKSSRRTYSWKSRVSPNWQSSWNKFKNKKRRCKTTSRRCRSHTTNSCRNKKKRQGRRIDKRKNYKNKFRTYALTKKQLWVQCTLNAKTRCKRCKSNWKRHREIFRLLSKNFNRLSKTLNRLFRITKSSKMN